jgi:hypothetical protein
MNEPALNVPPNMAALPPVKLAAPETICWLPLSIVYVPPDTASDDVPKRVPE